MESNLIPGDPISVHNIAQLDQEEEEFVRRLKDWEKQFESWKEQNIGHPDKEAFARYEKQWQECREILLQMIEQMQKAKAERAAAVAATSQAPATTTAAPAVDPNAALYYQQAQYMYPGGMPAVPPAAGAPPTQQFPYGGPEGYGQPPASAQEMQQPNSNRLSPKDSAELYKLKQLKEQAEQWKTLQQPTKAAAPWNYTTAVAGVSVSAPTVTTSGEILNTAGGAAANANVSQPNQAQLDQEEEEFVRRFKDWEKQFESWKEQNIGHPDKEAFARYEKQCQECREILLQMIEQMQKAKAERAAAVAATSQAPATTTAAPAVDPNAALYYQQAQYMYPGGMPDVPPAAGAPPTQQFPYGAPEGYGQPPASAQEMQQPNSNRLSPKDSAELYKLKQVKEQWKTVQQPTKAAAPWNYTTAAAGVSVSAPTVTTSGETLNTAGGAAANTNASQPNQLDQEEEEFERQFKDWEKHYESWKEQKTSHLDKEAFAHCEKRWQKWRTILLQKKEQMQKAKAERAAAATSQAPATTTAAPAVDPNAALYYQQAQYMYPGGMPAVPPAAGAPPTQQFPYGAPEGYGQPPASAQEMQQPNSNRTVSQNALDNKKILSRPKNSATAVTLSKIEISPPPEPKRESRRKRKLNPKYASSEYISIFDSKRKSCITKQLTQNEVKPPYAKKPEANILPAKDTMATKRMSSVTTPNKSLSNNASSSIDKSLTSLPSASSGSVVLELSSEGISQTKMTFNASDKTLAKTNCPNRIALKIKLSASENDNATNKDPNGHDTKRKMECEEKGSAKRLCHRSTAN